MRTYAGEIQLGRPDGRGAKLGTFSPISQVEGGGYGSHHGGISECERTDASESPSSPQKKGPILTTEEYRPGESPKRYSGTDSRQKGRKADASIGGAPPWRNSES